MKAGDSNPAAPEKKLTKTGEVGEGAPAWVEQLMNKMGDVERKVDWMTSRVDDE